MIYQLPEIPRLLTAIAEWVCCIICLMQTRRRFPKIATYVLCLLALFGQIGLQFLAEGLPPKLWILGMAMNVGFMFGVIALLADIRIIKMAYWTSVAFVAAEFFAACEWQLTVLLIRGLRPDFDWRATLFGIAFFSLFVWLFSYLESRLSKVNDLITERTAVSAVGLAVIAFTISNLAFINTGWRSTLSEQHYVYFVRTLVDFSAVVLLYLQQWTLQEQKYKDELSSIQNVLNMQYKQYLDYKESSEFIARQCHDLKHQIDALRSACSNEERETYLQEMERAINMYNGQNVTGNAVLDTLLTKKKIYCLEHEIDFSMKANGKSLSFLAVRDICTIIGNLLDNAIEYVSGLENSEERQIQGEIFEKGAFLMLRVENYYTGKPISGNHLPKTTKSDKLHHGFGLKSVRYIAEKYGGSMTVRSENNWFVVRVLIPLPQEK